MLAALRGHGFGWPKGRDRLLIVSVGAGRYPTRIDPPDGQKTMFRCINFADRLLERFPAKWMPVRVKRTRKKLEPRSDSIGSEKALSVSSPRRPGH
jgi:hypothetical protein